MKEHFSALRILLILLFISSAILSPAPASRRRVDGASGATPRAEETVMPDIQEAAIIARNYDYLPETITVKKGLPVRLYLTSIDRAHDIRIEQMDLSAKAVKGEVAVLDFTPEEAGDFEYICDIYCGPGHRGMKGRIVVIDGDMSEKE